MGHLQNTCILILCGGRSERMGEDKGLKQDREGPVWAGKLKEKVAYLGLPVYYSIRPEQEKAYRKAIPDGSFVMDKSFAFLNGPLTGILSAHLDKPDKNWLAIACDMQNLDHVVFDDLVNVLQSAKEGGHQAFIPKVNGQVQPLCGIYTCPGLAQLHQKYVAGDLKNRSMQSILLKEVKVYWLEFGEGEEGKFRNFNRPGDLG